MGENGSAQARRRSRRDERRRQRSNRGDGRFVAVDGLRKALPGANRSAARSPGAPDDKSEHSALMQKAADITVAAYRHTTSGSRRHDFRTTARS